MAAAYTIFGRQLSIATLGSVAAIVAWPRAPKAPVVTPAVSTTTAPAVKEDDFDLEKFIK
ncbi:hypothetical protein DFJ63DRAFT_334058 [Scheffersomyces coipomensis]|uniref:uncharacterized protein n=1 Tax=Scheffersomyces coipomensis TaxID=1788519 RepID=UPI00315CD784